ncbi:hypothetical protein EXE43_08230 [Halorubrum sp. SS5]|nr:hypothetical protein EXE43_08230 [Halorubrum sp. SS5]
MSVEIRTTENTSSVHQQGYEITPVVRTFTDWKAGQAVAGKPENRRDDVLLDRPTMKMGNRTAIDYDEKKHSLPSESVVLCGQDLYERLRSHNRDNWWQYREDSTISNDLIEDFKTHLIFAFSNELGLNSLQKQRAFSRFMKLDLRRGTGRTEVNAFMICALVANEDTKAYGSDKLYHPQRSDQNNDKEFQRLEEALKDRFSAITESLLTKVYNKLGQGDPPTRHRSQWKGKVKRECKIPNNPSVVTDQYDPRSETGSESPDPPI